VKEVTTMLNRRQSSTTAYDGEGPLALPLSPGLAGAMLLIARVLLGYIFVLSGWGKLMGLAGFAASLERQGIPASYALAILGAAVEFAGGLALILGIATRYAALALIVFTLAATGIAHRFWEFDEAARRGQAINFNKNMAMVGGLLAMFVAGPGRFSLDRLFASRRL
jgi:putative oxidoreductase